MLVLIGATPAGKKELVGFQTGVRESAIGSRPIGATERTALLSRLHTVPVSNSR